MTEATKAVIALAFEDRMNKLIAVHDKDNQPDGDTNQTKIHWGAHAMLDLHEVMNQTRVHYVHYEAIFRQKMSQDKTRPIPWYSR